MEKTKSELAVGLEAIEGLTFNFVHMGLNDKSESWDVPHDEWRVSVAYKGKQYSSSYRAGIGHRVKRPGWEREPNGKFYDNRLGYLSDFGAAKAGILKLQTPELADVMSCWLSDAMGTDQPFESWASDLGYDSDSRKALATYLECQKTRAALIKMLGQELFDSLSQMEH